MALTVQQLQDQRDKLVLARTNGRRTVTYEDGRSVTYDSGAAMDSALALIDDEIARLQGQCPPRSSLTTFSKGL